MATTGKEDIFYTPIACISRRQTTIVSKNKGVVEHEYEANGSKLD